MLIAVACKSRYSHQEYPGNKLWGKTWDEKSLLELKEKLSNQRVVCSVRHLAQTAPSPDVGVCVWLYWCSWCLCVKDGVRQTSLPVLPSFASANGSMMPVSDHCNHTFKILLLCQMLLSPSASFRDSCFHPVTAAPSVLRMRKQQLRFDWRQEAAPVMMISGDKSGFMLKLYNHEHATLKPWALLCCCCESFLHV